MFAKKNLHMGYVRTYTIFYIETYRGRSIRDGCGGVVAGKIRVQGDLEQNRQIGTLYVGYVPYLSKYKETHRSCLSNVQVFIVYCFLKIQLYIIFKYNIECFNT